MAAAESLGGQQASSSGGNPGGGGTSEGGADNIAELRESLRRTEGRLGETANELARHRQESKKATDVLTNLQRVLGGEEKPKEKQPSRRERADQMLDYFLRQHMEAERNGGGFPLTTTLASDVYEYIAESEGKWEKALQTIDRLNREVERLSNPMSRLTDGAYSNIDAQVIENLEKLYGRGDQNLDIKRAQYAAVGDVIAAEVQRMQKEHPDVWEEVLRSPKKQAALARHFVEKNLPPKARELIEHDQLMNTDMPVGELWAAFRQAGEIQDPEARSKIREKIRQEIVAQQFGEARAGRGGKISGMY